VVGSVELDTIDASLLGRAQARVSRAQEALDLARSTQAAAHIDAARKAALAARASSLVGQLGDDQRKAASAVQAAHERLVAVAVASYTSGGPGSSVDALLSARTIGDFARRQTIFTTVAQTSSAALKAYEHARHDASRSTLRSVDALQGAKVAKAAAEERVPVSDDAVARASLALADRRKVLTLVSDAVPTVGTDIPGMVLDAYRRAALAVEAHGCSLGWWGLAGIGKVESNHGRANRAQLTPAGELVPYIVGIALDGSNGTQAVAATDGGRFDGDPVFDHAVGPLQFITSTWVSWGRNGRGGHYADPNNIYDAALGAATYLCAASTELTTEGGLRTAYLSYNHSDSYAAEVLSYALAYRNADASVSATALPDPPLYALAPPGSDVPPSAFDGPVPRAGGSSMSPPTTAPRRPGGQPPGPPGAASPPSSTLGPGGQPPGPPGALPVPVPTSIAPAPGGQPPGPPGALPVSVPTSIAPAPAGQPPGPPGGASPTSVAGTSTKPG